MTDNKISDAEIKKALEYCCGSIQNECRDCPFGERCENDESLLKYSLDLINRKDAEIERLQKKIDYLKDMNKKNDAHLHVRLIEQAKSEAYKEFAEKVKEEITKTLWRVITDLKYEGNKLFLRGLIFENIDNTLKEFTEGGNEDGMD